MLTGVEQSLIPLPGKQHVLPWSTVQIRLRKQSRGCSRQLGAQGGARAVAPPNTSAELMQSHCLRHWLELHRQARLSCFVATAGTCCLWLHTLVPSHQQSRNPSDEAFSQSNRPFNSSCLLHKAWAKSLPDCFHPQVYRRLLHPVNELVGVVASITADLHANVYGNPQAAAEASKNALRIMVGACLLACALWPLLTFAAWPGVCVSAVACKCYFVLSL